MYGMRTTNEARPKKHRPMDCSNQKEGGRRQCRYSTRNSLPQKVPVMAGGSSQKGVNWPQTGGISKNGGAPQQRHELAWFGPANAKGGFRRGEQNTCPQN